MSNDVGVAAAAVSMIPLGIDNNGAYCIRYKVECGFFHFEGIARSVNQEQCNALVDRLTWALAGLAVTAYLSVPFGLEEGGLR